jgi:hypothetical protein
MVPTSTTENIAHGRDVQTRVPGNLALPVRISLDSLSHLFYKMHEDVSAPSSPPRESISLYDLKHNKKISQGPLYGRLAASTRWALC